VKKKDNKKPNRKRGKGNNTLRKKRKQTNKKKKAIKEKEPKIKVLTHELLDFTLLSNGSSLVILQFFKSLHRLFPCQVWSSSASPPITNLLMFSAPVNNRVYKIV